MSLGLQFKLPITSIAVKCIGIEGMSNVIVHNAFGTDLLSALDTLSHISINIFS